ncbi:MAG TPA: hypothetical protein VMW69_03980 [Spirochaetia bacterium]|nr:hypothetical protein [Spirochaetia bacterium]
MIPSDHYVRFYNELFKMLEERGHEELQGYWMEISRLQRTILGPFIEADGLAGMYTYWAHIREEENCEADLDLTEDYFEFKMLKCPSLSKAMDNDAGAFIYYCDHCAGWIKPVVEGYGYYVAYDMISRTEPRCILRVYKDKEKADEFLKTAQLPARPYGD